MNKRLFAAFLSLTFLAVACSEFKIGKDGSVTDKAVSNQDFAVYGDMVIAKSSIAKSRLSTQAGTNLDYYQGRLWPNGVVPLEFEPGTPQAQKDHLFKACRGWSEKAHVTCVTRTQGAVPYAYINLSDYDQDNENRGLSCFSNVGAYASGNKSEM
ncbi:MAG: hypothetical protein AB7F59_14980 [Bdellovibrionales bacterium]